MHVLVRLANLIEQERDDLLARWRSQVRELPAAQGMDTPTLNDHIPVLLTELVSALRERSDETVATRSTALANSDASTSSRRVLPVGMTRV